MTIIDQLQRGLFESGCQGAADAIERALRSIQTAQVDLALARGELLNMQQSLAPFISGLNPGNLGLAKSHLEEAQKFLNFYTIAQEAPVIEVAPEPVTENAP